MILDQHPPGNWGSYRHDPDLNRLVRVFDVPAWLVETAKTEADRRDLNAALVAIYATGRRTGQNEGRAEIRNAMRAILDLKGT